MGVIIPQVVTEDRASGAQVIDGSLKFDKSKNQYLEWTPSSSGNRKTWTFSCWLKRNNLGDGSTNTTAEVVFSSGFNTAPWGIIQLNNDNTIQNSVFAGSSPGLETNAFFRDTGSFLHLCSVFDTTATGNDKWRTYINGVQQTYSNSNYPSDNTDYQYSESGKLHRIGYGEWYAGFQMSQCYFVDGQALGPENFGYTDPLTNTWRPKKYEGTFGTNGFYLPMDGNSPIGKDQSGNGNDWTPVNFGGSVELSKATGAIPILNTNEAGTVAKKGLRTDSKTYTVTASGGNYYLDGALKPTLNAYRGGSYTFDYTGATSHPFYLSGMPDGKHNSKAYSVSFDGTDGTDLQLTNHADLQVGSESNWTIEFFVRKTGSFVDYDVITGKGQGGQFEWFIEGFANNQVRFLYSANGSTTWTGDHVLLQYMSDNQWYHFAAVRNGTSFKMYVDGIETFSTTGFDIHAGTGPLHIGGYGGAASQDPPVQISNYRIVKGTSVYTSNFTRPGTTLENITNTKLLCCHDSSATTATVAPVSITSNGGVSVIQTHQPFLYIDSEGGVNTATSNTTKITIPHHAADTLYYYCSAHSGMGSSINVTTDIFKADPYAWKCVLAIPGGGSITSEVSPQLNVTSSDKTFTQTGTVTSSGITNFYGVSTDYAANPDAGDQTATVYSTSSQSSDFAWGGGDFTWEWWMYHHDWDNGGGNLDQAIIFQYDGGSVTNMIETYIQGHIFSIYQQKPPVNSYVQIEGSNIIFTLQNNQWVHCALVREGGYYKFFRDGVYLGKSPLNTTSWGDSIIVLGRNEGNDLNGFDGLFQDIRMYGTAKYTASTVGERAFTVGSIVPDVLPDTPSGITGKTNLAKITEGAVAFNGTGDYLSIPGNTDFQMGTGDFTIECYFNVNGAVPTGCWRGIISLGGHTTAGGITIYAPRANDPVDTVVVILNTVNPTMGSTINVKHGWHHVALVRNSGTTKLYVDGIEQSSISDTNDYNYSGTVYIGSDADCGGTFYQGFISNVRIVKGTALYTSNFTPPTEPLTEVTNTKLLCCQSMTSSVAAAVTPGSITSNGNAAATNFNPFTDDINAIRGQETGYATLNPLAKWEGTLSNGNLTMTGGNDIPSTIGVSSGKWYAETMVNDVSSLIHFGICATGTKSFLGAANNGHVLNNMDYLMIRTDSAGPFNAAARGAIASWSQVSDTGATFTTGDIIGIELDMDNLFVKFYKNNVLRTHFTFTLASTFDKMFFYNRNNGSAVSTWNFGQNPFKFPPSDGFQPLNASTLRSETVIVRPDQYVGISTWTGNGTSQTISGLKHKPDFVWSKATDFGADHELYDSVRGTMKRLFSSLPNQESTPSSGVNSFNVDGFGVTGGGGVNNNTSTYVGWTWKAGGNKNTFNVDDVGYATAAAAGLTAGNASRVTGSSVGTKQGFSIIKYQGTGGSISLPHGLQQTPDFMIMKSLDNSEDWAVYTTVIDGSYDYLYLNTKAAKADSGITPPTSSVFYRGSADADGENIIAYLWHNVPGLQKFGTYTGNGSGASGPFVELGFRPAIIWIKDVSAVGTYPDYKSWVIYDSKRPGYNVGNGSVLYANLANGEGSRGNGNADGYAENFVITSNGFAVQHGAGSWGVETNESGRTYLYCAWAGAPTSNLYGAQANAF